MLYLAGRTGGFLSPSPPLLACLLAAAAKDSVAWEAISQSRLQSCPFFLVDLVIFPLYQAPTPRLWAPKKKEETREERCCFFFVFPFFPFPFLPVFFLSDRLSLSTFAPPYDRCGCFDLFLSAIPLLLGRSPVGFLLFAFVP
ncbi:hypothetical protein P170DRAFT_117658 [Aspergillus steynii IBT 23096]|uniref:Uncharacterized protein n=1 Tax=Aspergillus steynii IBT 23096 TaxID=1392250 RepID=A0A2I2GJC3_9EURO|nr:uncharacterized protein P170DRAFT_117658 [Aspergillus steynii IBT 23096]PLB52937.1 hypothetical protein P170DRAFT_117658 [Aspergillus steynii IBT 23096]